MSNEAPDLDTFSSPVEPAADAGVKLPENSPEVVESVSLDTFDTPMEVEEKPQEEAKSRDEKDKKKLDESQTGQLEEGKDGEPKKTDEESDEEEEVSEEEGQEAKSKESEDAEKGSGAKVKTIKGSSEQGGVQVPDDTAFRVKIKGKSESVPLKELINNYTGKVVYDEKFGELNTQTQEFTQKEQKFLQERGQVLERLGNIIDIIDDPEKSPDEAVGYLLDLAGRNSYDFKKRFFESMADEFEAYGEMEDTERRAYWAEKKVEYLERSSKSSAKLQEDRQTREDAIQRVDQLRETYDVSEDQYVSAHHDLLELGEGQPTPQQVVKYAALLPNEDDYEGVVQGIAEALMGKVSEQSIVEELTRAYGDSDSDEINELNKKVWDSSLDSSQKTKAKRRPYEKADSEKGLEFFNDIDPDYN